MNKIYKIFPFLIPVLLSLSFPLTLYGKNLGQVTFEQTVISFICVLLGTILVAWVSTKVFHEMWKSIAVTCVLSVVFFTYTDIFSLVNQSVIVQVLPKTSPSFELVIHLLLVFLILTILIYKTKKQVVWLIPFLGVFACSAFLISLFPICKYSIHRYSTPVILNEEIVLSQESNNTLRPDIYYIVPDSHSSEEVMKKYFEYDMSKFTKGLEDKGFRVFHQSTSNYPKTLLSLSSSLNMKYLTFPSSLSDSIDETLLYPLIENNGVLQTLKRMGYSYYQLGSWWEGTKINTYANKNILADNTYPVSMNGFTYALLSTTILRPFISEYPQVFLGETSKEKFQRLQFQFSSVEEVAHLPGPKFVFYHIIAPHPPYVFDKNCEERDVTDFSEKASQKNYVEQLECIDNKLNTMITTIQNISSRSAVIILQSDEGIDFYDGKDKWDTAQPSELQRKFPILTALFLPGIDISFLPETLTPVNIFRVVLNSYFHSSMLLLEDKNYIWNNTRIYDLIDVTETIQQPQSN